MRIAQVAPLYESVPPSSYGGTERVVSYLTDELVRQGHDVTLFASGDSATEAKLRPVCDTALRLGHNNVIDPIAHHLRMVEMVARDADQFDIVHFHIDYLHFPVTRREKTCAVTTLHGRLDIPDIAPLFREFDEMNLVSISDAQRTPLPWANWVGTVHHGLPENLYTLGSGEGGYLAFLGRISPEKRADRAIAIAKRAGVPIKIAAKIDDVDKEYFDAQIRGLLDDPLVEYVGEIGEREKNDFLGNARALLFPIDWPEPFGLVVIEALACGTPVIAHPMGSVPEILDNGVTGFIVKGIDDGAKAVEGIDLIQRRACRQAFEQRFTVDHMARNYSVLYQRLTGGPELAARDAALVPA